MGLRRYSSFDQPRQRGSWALRFWQAMLVLGLLWAIGFLGFAASIPSRPGDKMARSDGIIVLTGGGDRLAEGLRLLQEKRADRLLVSGVAPGLDFDDIQMGLGPDRVALDPALLACCVEIDHAATSTEENAIEGARWIASHDLRSVFIVTANYHMNRSLLKFRRALDAIGKREAVALRAYPVFPAEILDDYWFLKPRVLWLIVGEYHKSLAAILRAWWRDRFPA